MNLRDEILNQVDEKTGKMFCDITTEEWFSNNQFSIDVFNEKYKMYEDETPPKSIFRFCDYISDAEENEELKRYWCKRWFNEISSDYWYPGGSIISGSGTDRNISLCNCTTIKFSGDDPDSLEEIFDVEYKVSKMAALRQGIGINFTPLRPLGFKVNNSSRYSLGVTHWMKRMDRIGMDIGQAGRTPALLFALSSEHLDITDFLDLKAGSINSLRNANISVHATNKFMEVGVSGENMTLGYKSPYEYIEKVINPKELIKRASKNMLIWAEPGFQFIDTMKISSNSTYVGYEIIGGNVCAEKNLSNQGVCLLGSLNPEKFSTDLGTLDEELYGISHSINRFLDNVNTIEIRDKRYATKLQGETIQALRECGIGYTNMVGYLFKCGLDYNSDDGVKRMVKFTELMNKNLYISSQNLGKERGSFGAFDREKYLEAPFIKNMVERYGFEFNHMRNCNLTCIAPTGSISTQFRDCVMSYGVEPSFGLYYWKRAKINNKKWSYYFVVPKAVQDYMRVIGHDLEMESDSVEDDFEGTIGLSIKNKIDKYCDIEVSSKVSLDVKLSLLSKLYKHIDSAISVTNIVDEKTTVDDVEKFIYDAWKSGIKSFTLYREGKRLGIIENITFFERAKQLTRDGIKLTHHDLNEDQFEKLNIVKNLEEPCHIQIKERPETLDARVHRTIVKGDPFYVIISSLDYHPYELFILRENGDTKIPQSKFHSGLVRKIKSGQYQFEDKDLTINNISEHNNSDSNEVLVARFISLMLRSRTPIKDIIEQISKSAEYIGDYASNLRRILRKYEVGDEECCGKVCPSCGKNTLMRIDGCFSCISCEYKGSCE